MVKTRDRPKKPRCAYYGGVTLPGATKCAPRMDPDLTQCCSLHADRLRELMAAEPATEEPRRRRSA